MTSFPQNVFKPRLRHQNNTSLSFVSSWLTEGNCGTVWLSTLRMAPAHPITNLKFSSKEVGPGSTSFIWMPQRRRME